jgi:hypothetical protein
MRNTLRLGRWVFALVAIAAGAQGSLAGSVYFSFAGNDSAGDQVAANVLLTPSNGQITALVTNLLVDPTDVGQNITSVLVTLTNTNATNATMPNSQSSATVRTVNSDGTYTDSGTRSTGWGLVTKNNNPNGNQITNNQFYIDWFSRDKSVAGQQAQSTLLGRPGANSKYNNANGSIAGSNGGNDAHDPFLAGTATFAVTVPNATATTQISGVTFYFGTQFGPYAVGVAPEPASVLLFGGGVGLIGLIRWRRRARVAA